MKPLKVFSVAVVLMYLVSSCGKPVSPQYLGYQNLRMEKVGFTNNVVAIDVKLYNPNRYPLQLKSASLDMYINNSFLGHSALDSLVVLPAQDTVYIPLRLQASAKDILSNTAKILLNPDVKVKITGSAKAGRGGFFINVPIDYEGVQRIELLGNN
ncbi:MAG: type 2 family protein [Flavisolibacter sp.]|jgi:LEA14-like dessication related protein|nr:type 2 family protein [Flavisolibacter sp.]